MVLPEVKEELKAISAKTNKIPNERVIEMQRNIIKLLGYNADFGCQCLSTVPRDFPNDRELMMKMQYFSLGAELACQ